MYQVMKTIRLFELLKEITKFLICTEANDSKQILNGSLPCFSS